MEVAGFRCSSAPLSPSHQCGRRAGALPGTLRRRRRSPARFPGESAAYRTLGGRSPRGIRARHVRVIGRALAWRVPAVLPVRSPCPGSTEPRSRTCASVSVSESSACPSRAEAARSVSAAMTARRPGGIGSPSITGMVKVAGIAGSAAVLARSSRAAAMVAAASSVGGSSGHLPCCIPRHRFLRDCQACRARCEDLRPACPCQRRRLLSSIGGVIHSATVLPKLILATRRLPGAELLVAVACCPAVMIANTAGTTVDVRGRRERHRPALPEPVTNQATTAPGNGRHSATTQTPVSL